jgi:hypothetical protein
MQLVIPDFPNTHFEPFIITSPQTTFYNCIAWAFGDDSKWYWPDPDDMAYWPPNISRTVDINSFIELYNLIGYNVCQSPVLETGFEKIAIFVDSNNIPTHAARQVASGLWTSKLGMEYDIQHTLASMNNGVYGVARVFMSR